MPGDDVVGEVVDPRVKDVVERIFPEKEVADDPEALCVLASYPEFPQISHSVDSPLHHDHFFHEKFVRSFIFRANLLNDLVLFLDESDNGFSKIFGNVFGLISNLLFLFLF